MVNTTSSPYGRRRTAPAERTGVLARLSRYDLLLVLIPVAFVLAVVAGLTLSIPLPTAIALASVVGLAAIVDGVYLNPPPAGH